MFSKQRKLKKKKCTCVTQRKKNAKKNSLKFTDAYTSGELVYEWQDNSSVNFVPGMFLSQFDLMGYPQRNLTFARREGDFSVLQVSFNLQRHTGYFLIQVRLS